jgi:hypothetical protein
MEVPNMLKRIGAVAVTALVLAGCGGSSSSSGTKTISLSRAAYVSAASPGYKMAMSMRETIPNVGQLTINGTGSFSLPSHEGSMTMQMGIPSAAAAQAGLSNIQLQAVFAHGTFYMKLPSAVAGKIPGGKPWWEFNLNQIGKLAGVPGLSSLMSSTSSLNDPGQYLDFLRATASGSVKNLGPDTVNGVPTTHYRAAVDLAKLPGAVPASARPGVERMIAALKNRGALTPQFPIDAWIDSSQLIRRIEMNFSQPLGTGSSAQVAMKVDFVDYGPQPAPQIPPPSETVNLLALLQRAGL